MKVTLDENAIMPTKAHSSDAGFDLYLPMRPDEIIIKPGKTAIIDTGVHMAIPEGHVGLCLNKSGLSIKSGIESITGVIDAGYTGAITVKLRNTGKDTFIFEPGDKISQIVVMPICTEELQLVEELDETERGSGGFGSTGR